MALPTLNETPKYDIVIPSSKKKTTFRPYLVKEEKVLLMASETGDETMIARAAIDLIKACVDESLDEKNITVFDMEYLFCQIRSKSVGETSNVILNCSNCGHENMITVNLDKVEVKHDTSRSNMIELTSEVNVEMRYPSYYGLINNQHLNDSDSEIEQMYHTILSCIKAISTNDERILVDNEPFEDLVHFVNSMTPDQYQKLQDYVMTAPSVSMEHKWTCEECKKEHLTELKGLQDFF